MNLSTQRYVDKYEITRSLQRNKIGEINNHYITHTKKCEGNTKYGRHLSFLRSY